MKLLVCGTRFCCSRCYKKIRIKHVKNFCEKTCNHAENLCVEKTEMVCRKKNRRELFFVLTDFAKALANI